MPTLEEIKRPVGEHIREYEKFLSSILQSESPYASAICNYILSIRGKQIRPLFVLLSAALHGKVVLESYAGAALVEMVHTASLVHDDVVDEADMRRGRPSVNALWRSRTAVLAGDYIFARTLHTCMQYGSFSMLKEITRAIYEVSEGELIQTEQSEKLDMTEEIYYMIIRKKTASLIGASGAIGALSAQATPEQTESMRQFGINLGTAFQIRDDILDFSPTEVTGKPACGDLREHKITLPLLHVLDKASDTERARLIHELNHVHLAPAHAEYLRDAVVEAGGIGYATDRMEHYKEQAIAYLAGYPDSDVRRSLEGFADYVLTREN